VTGSQGATGAKGPQGAQGSAGPQNCFSHFVVCGASCEAVCDQDGSTVYSDCATLAIGCFLFSDGACTTFTCEDGFVFDGATCWQTSGNEIVANPGCGRSDARLKTNVQTLKNSLDIVLALNPVEFDWKEITPEYDWFVENGITHSIGFIAQEVKQLVPEIVILKDNGYYTIDYPKINALLVEGIKEQQVFIDEVEKDIIYLEKYFNI